MTYNWKKEEKKKNVIKIVYKIIRQNQEDL